MSKPPANRRATNVRQRKKQHHLLDVKIRASTERRRTIARCFSVTFRLILIGSLIAGSWIGGREALRRFVFENPDYAIREVKYLTDGTLTREQVLKTGELGEGRNIFLVNLSKARTEIEKMPQVESVEVTRTLPNQLSVTVTERRPIAWVVANANDDPTVSDKAFLIDATGMLMKSKARLEEYLHFPVISGVQTGNLVAGERVTSSEMQAALELIRLTAESTRFQARHVDLSKGYCLVVTAHSHAKITFALDHIETQLARLHRYLARAAEDMMEIQTVNLVVERNTPVTFVEPEPAEGETPDSAKPLDPKAKPAAGAAIEKPKQPAPAATPAPRATAVATPIPIAPAAPAKPGFFSPVFKSKAGSTPVPAKTEGVKKQPFRLH
jgi:cell division protein FtsQ